MFDKQIKSLNINQEPKNKPSSNNLYYEQDYGLNNFNLINNNNNYNKNYKPEPQTFPYSSSAQNNNYFQSQPQTLSYWSPAQKNNYNYFQPQQPAINLGGFGSQHNQNFGLNPHNNHNYNYNENDGLEDDGDEDNDDDDKDDDDGEQRVFPQGSKFYCHQGHRFKIQCENRFNLADLTRDQCEVLINPSHCDQCLYCKTCDDIMCAMTVQVTIDLN